MATGQPIYVPNRNAVTFRTVTVVTSGTPVQGPNVAIPDSMALTVSFRVTQDGSPKGFVAASSADTATSTARDEILKGDVLKFNLNNMNLLWFDSDTDGAVFELNAEQ